jgi:NitT/TauT family transport system substrate-binding protein
MDLALELGYFGREGVEVELIRVQQTPSAIAAILSGEGEMANVSVSAVLQLHAQGAADLKAVASPNKALPFLIAARDDLSIAGDLKGKRFGVGRIGSLDHSLSTKVLVAEGIAMEDLQVVTLGQPAVRAQSLAAGQIDATTMSIGTWLSIPDKSGLTVLVPQDRYYAVAPVVNKVNVVSGAVLETRAEEAEAVIRALVRISRDFATDPSAWAKAMAPHAGSLSAAQLEELARSFAGGWSVNGGMNREELTFTQEWLWQTEDFAGLPQVPLETWVNFDLVDAILDDLGPVAGADAPGR